MQCAVLPPDLGADRHARNPGGAESHYLHQVRKNHIRNFIFWSKVYFWNVNVKLIYFVY